MTDIEFFKSNGYVILRSAIEEDLIDRFWSSVDDNTQGNRALTFSLHGKLVTPADLRTRAPGAHLSLRDPSGETLRIVDIESHSPVAPDLMLHPTIASFLRSWYGIEPTAIQTLTYAYGSQQGAHSDRLLVEPPTVGPDYARGTLAASWIACEDTDDGNGPLIVYPGSHKLAKKRLVEDFAGDYAKYVSHLQQICADAGIAGKTFHARKGDVLFWHGDLVHAGAVINDPSRTRKTLVTHYARVPAQAKSVSPAFRRIRRQGGWYYTRATSVAGTQRRRRIAFIGNCQVEALMILYQRHGQPETDDESRFIGSYRAPSPDDLAFVRSADAIVEQVQSMKPVFQASSEAPRDAQWFRVPLVTGEFLWPFWSKGHPRSEDQSGGTAAGPYLFELGDSFLNRLISRGVAADVAASRYLALDVASRIDLDRLYEISITKQRLRDRAAGYDTATLIESTFRKQGCFFTPQHPTVVVMAYLAEEFFRRFGVSDQAIRRARRALVANPPFGEVEWPIHPAVSRHFGLRYASDDYRYRFQDEGRFTFSESARRYMRHEWNPGLQEGLAACRAGRFHNAIRLLDAALVQSPESVSGWLHKGIAHESLGQLAQAAADVRRAADIEPDNPRVVSQLGHLALKMGDSARALTLARRAAELSPGTASFQVDLAHLLAKAGDLSAAKNAFVEAIELDPFHAGVHDALGHALFQLGDFVASASAFREAARLAPEVADYQAHRCRALNAAGDLVGATAAIGLATRLEPGRADFHATLGHVLAAGGDLGAAEQAFRKALELDPGLEDAREALEHVP